jgi:hypothetical protein
LGLSGYTLAHQLYAKPVGNGSSLLVRRNIAVELGGYDSSWAAQGIGGCEDYDFELKIAAKYPVAFVNEYLIGYRLYPGNMSSNYSRMARALIATVEMHIGRSTELPRWFVRMARASVFEYAALNFVSARSPISLLFMLFRLMLVDLPRGVKVLFKSIPLRLWHFLRKTTEKPLLRAHFDDFASNAEKTCYTPSARERKTLERIKQLDSFLGQRVVEVSKLPAGRARTDRQP